MATKTAAKKIKKDYRIEKKRSGRFTVKTKDGKIVKAEKKVEILVKEGLLKHASKKKAAAEAPAT